MLKLLKVFNAVEFHILNSLKVNCSKQLAPHPCASFFSWTSFWLVFCRCHLLNIPEIVRKLEGFLKLSWNQKVYWYFQALYKWNISQKCNEYFDYQLYAWQNYTYEVPYGREFLLGRPDLGFLEFES